MLKKKAVRKTAVVCFLAVFLFLILPYLVLAQDQFGLEAAAQIGLPRVDLKVAIVRIIQIILGFLGLVAVIIILYGGYVYMTAAGDPKKTEKAKKILIDAIIGLIIILAAFTIVSFIIRALGGGGGGGGRPCPGCDGDLGRWGIGRGPIESVYPAPGQTEVPINTFIAVTFKENVKPETICDDLNGNGICDNGEFIRSESVEICKLVDSNTSDCETTGDFTIDSFITTTVMNRSGDNRTFVFTPNKYLGFEDFQDRDFKVLLKSGIKKASNGEPILKNLFNQQYYWSFTTNGELDLDPPEIVSTNAILNPLWISPTSGVYPNPDDQADTYTVSNQPTPTTFTFSVTAASFTSIESEVAASYTQPVNGGGTTVNATLSGDYGGTGSGKATTTMSGGANSATTEWPGAMPDFTSFYNGSSTIDIGPYGLIFNLTGRAVGGNNWTFTVTAYQPGDKIEILRNENLVKTYIIGRDISKGSGDADLISNIKNKIFADSGVIFESCTTAEGCDIKTKQTGDDSARYEIRSVKYNSTAQNLIESDDLMVAKVNGADSTENQDPGESQRDVPKNTIFQINFNEAINPIFVDKVVVKFDRNGDGAVDTAVSGTQIEVSNLYRTLEFKGPIECGINSCGNQIYCWPVNDYMTPGNTSYDPDDLSHKATNYEVSVEAASLIPHSDGRCAQWGGQSEQYGRCRKAIGGQTVYYPMAKIPFDGLIDMAANSFNGSFDYYEENNKVKGISEGKSDAEAPICVGCSGYGAYILNDSVPLYNISSTIGDDFKWSFFVSDRIDRQAPLVEKIDTANLDRKGNGTTTDLLAPVDLAFDRIMRSATLKPGWNYGDTPKDRSLRYLALDTLGNSNPVGYWVGKENLDSDNDIFPDYTRVDINHNPFSVNVRYSPLAGSGIESITQNCFLPSAGPAEAGSGSCSYSGETATDGCVNVTLPNPASYGKLNCLEITDAEVCAGTEICKVLYYDEDNLEETNRAGSWILTKDFSRGADSDAVNSGCCLGVCEGRP